ncbi:diphthine-ammonia ligase [Bacilli bacterium PM5-3]|nr:diphthine-ammonia ligase [Bacilli bacterium PM5-3]MDH6604172.1 diphthine-ammonia ligase [Bacilli bacterium PM5-9]
MRFVVSFSGGKDSMLAMHRMIEAGNECVGIFTTTNENIGSWFHDIEIPILKAIANNLNVDFIQATLNVKNYNEMFESNLYNIKEKYNIDAVVFGDIDIEDHKKWCLERCQALELQAIFPLWNNDRKAIVQEFIDLKYQAIIKRIDKNKLDKSFLGKTLNNDLLEKFKEYNIDLCGENGEYHTLVYDGPLFKNEVGLLKTDIKETENTYILGVKLNEE